MQSGVRSYVDKRAQFSGNSGTLATSKINHVVAGSQILAAEIRQILTSKCMLQMRVSGEERRRVSVTRIATVAFAEHENHLFCLCPCLGDTLSPIESRAGMLSDASER